MPLPRAESRIPMSAPEFRLELQQCLKKKHSHVFEGEKETESPISSIFHTYGIDIVCQLY